MKKIPVLNLLAPHLFETRERTTVETLRNAIEDRMLEHRVDAESPPPRSEKSAGRTTQIVEWTLLEVAPRAGEELNAIAYK